MGHLRLMIARCCAMPKGATFGGTNVALHPVRRPGMDRPTQINPPWGIDTGPHVPYNRPIDQPPAGRPVTIVRAPPMRENHQNHITLYAPSNAHHAP